MQAIKQYTEVINGSIHIDLPKNFTAKRVELIILSADDNNADSGDFQRFLLDSPEMSDEEYQAIPIPDDISRQFGIQPGWRLDWSPIEGRDEILIRVIPGRGELARRLLGAGQRFSPERDSIAELIAEREADN